MGIVAQRGISPQRLNERLIVGKDVLELLSSAMYVEPLCVYREYIQNSADAIDEAVASGLYSPGEKPRIDVIIDSKDRVIRIRDNGIGVTPNSFCRRLTSLGASKKRGSNARGFRGVGRLSGLAYCQQLVFRSKSANAPRSWEIRWDCNRLRELLRDSSFEGDINETMYEVIEFDTKEGSDEASHYFEVELRNVSRTSNDVLLNSVAVAEYLAQVGPVPFASTFRFSQRIDRFLTKYLPSLSYQIFVNGSKKPLVRPFRNSFEAKRTVIDKFSKIEFFEIPAVTGGIDAVGWLLHHNYNGAISDRLGINGLRLRTGNIQLGDNEVFKSVFPEPRFNAWTVGEVHLVSSRLVPNGRRDDLEQSKHQQNLLNHIALYAKRVARTCRTKSAQRNRKGTIATCSRKSRHVKVAAIAKNLLVFARTSCANKRAVKSLLHKLLSDLG